MQFNNYLSFISISLYLIAALFQSSRLFGKNKQFKPIIISLAWIALIIHSFLLYRWIDVEAGQNLSLINMISQVLWVMALITNLSISIWPLENLTLAIYPLAAFSILFAVLWPTQQIVTMQDDWHKLIHILSSFVSAGLIFVSAFQAFVFALQHYFLKHRKKLFLLKSLPSLEQTETLLFRFILWGFFFLTIQIALSFWSFKDAFLQVWQHVFFALTAWIFYLILLVTHFYLGWRGTQKIKLVFAGFIMLLLSYFAVRSIF